MPTLSHRDGERQERPLPRGITVRQGTENDEFSTFEVMRRAMGYEMNWNHHAPARRHLRLSPHSSFWVAEETPRFGPHRIIGYARSLVRDRVWSLTEFFVLPGHHRKGIGGALLARCLEDGDRAGADTRLVLASQHPGADSLYIRRAGCFPRLPMLLLAGSAGSLRLKDPDFAPILDPMLPAAAVRPLGGGGEGETLRAEPFLLSPTVQAELDELDQAVVGYARPTEHTLWAAMMGGPQGASRLFRRAVDRAAGPAGELVGYAYVGPHSSGPVLALDPQMLPRLMTHVAALAAAKPANPAEAGFLIPTEQYCAIAGTNEVMLCWLLECGWQIVFQYLFMSTRPLGQLDRYVCHNPLYVL